jgi:hypothetical protein
LSVDNHATEVDDSADPMDFSHHRVMVTGPVLVTTAGTYPIDDAKGLAAFLDGKATRFPGLRHTLEAAAAPVAFVFVGAWLVRRAWRGRRRVRLDLDQARSEVVVTHHGPWGTSTQRLSMTPMPSVTTEVVADRASGSEASWLCLEQDGVKTQLVDVPSAARELEPFRRQIESLLLDGDSRHPSG